MPTVAVTVAPPTSARHTTGAQKQSCTNECIYSIGFMKPFFFSPKENTFFQGNLMGKVQNVKDIKEELLSLRTKSSSRPTPHHKQTAVRNTEDASWNKGESLT